MKTLALVTGLALVAAGCGGPSQVSFVSTEKPSNVGGASPEAIDHAHPGGGGMRELAQDDEIVEPDHPLVSTREERALVHIHTPDGTCSGAVLGPRLVVTAHQCVAKDRGVTPVGADREIKVELASSALTWTNRRVSAVVAPSCDWDDLDVAVLVLAACGSPSQNDSGAAGGSSGAGGGAAAGGTASGTDGGELSQAQFCAEFAAAWCSRST